MDGLYDKTSLGCSELITKRYSTSFYLGIQLLRKKFRSPIYSIYGFVRLADEIVDASHPFEKESLLARFKAETFAAIQEGVSLNPALHSFQRVCNQYKIDPDLIHAFFNSMSMDLHVTSYSIATYNNYIFGSAEAVGLMCLKVFCEGDCEKYSNLQGPARSLGAAFQKVNFLRDLKDDYVARGRIYFPNLIPDKFTEEMKAKIAEEIEEDFMEAYKGILKLPEGARHGVYLAYIYYLQLFKKIKNSDPAKIRNARIRLPNLVKYFLLAQTYLKYRMNFL